MQNTISVVVVNIANSLISYARSADEYFKIVKYLNRLKIIHYKLARFSSLDSFLIYK